MVGTSKSVVMVRVRRGARSLLAVALPGLLLAGCGGGMDGHAPGAAMTSGPVMSGGMATSASFGQPGDPGKASRTVDIQAKDSMSFDPATVRVSAGETVTFRVTNVGRLEHEFVLAPREQQGRHRHSATPEPDAALLDPGKSQSLTWTFAGPGQVLYGCHLPGHYEAGMFGTIDVTP